MDKIPCLMYCMFGDYRLGQANVSGNSSSITSMYCAKQNLDPANGSWWLNDHHGYQLVSAQLLLFC